jgi:hypothetical protein
VIAKASTTCTYSLDPITLSPGLTQAFTATGIYFSRLCHPSPQEEPGKGWSIQSLPCVDSHPNRKTIPRPRLKLRTATLYFSKLLKNSRCTNRNWLHPLRLKTRAKSALSGLPWLCSLDSLPNPPEQIRPSPHPHTHPASAIGGGERDRTDDLMLAKHALSQLSYTPGDLRLVGLGGFEPPTPALSRRCSNQLSYRPGL